MEANLAPPSHPAWITLLRQSCAALQKLDILLRRGGTVRPQRCKPLSSPFRPSELNPRPAAPKLGHCTGEIPEGGGKGRGGRQSEVPC